MRQELATALLTATEMPVQTRAKTRCFLFINSTEVERARLKDMNPHAWVCERLRACLLAHPHASVWA